MRWNLEFILCPTVGVINDVACLLSRGKIATDRTAGCRDETAIHARAGVELVLVAAVTEVSQERFL